LKSFGVISDVIMVGTIGQTKCGNVETWTESVSAQIFELNMHFSSKWLVFSKN